jgi:hypothetical protein
VWRRPLSGVAARKKKVTQVEPEAEQAAQEQAEQEQAAPEQTPQE